VYGSLKKIVSNTSYPPDEAILNLHTKEEPEAGFTSTGDNEENGRDTDTTNNEIIDDAAQENDVSYGRNLFKKKKSDNIKKFEGTEFSHNDQETEKFQDETNNNANQKDKDKGKWQSRTNRTHRRTVSKLKKRPF
jgi:hypothetical protein